MLKREWFGNGPCGLGPAAGRPDGQAFGPVAQLLAKGFFGLRRVNRIGTASKPSSRRMPLMR